MEIKSQFLFCAVAVVIFSISSSQTTAISILGVGDKIEPELAVTTEQTEASDYDTAIIPKGCKNDPDCKDSERCLENQCSAICTDLWCGDHGDCIIENHVAICNFTHHSDYDNEYDCVDDDDCEHDDRCKDGICINMCQLHECGLNEECSIVENQAVCILPIGISNRFGESGCTTNADCKAFEKCDNSTCIDACYPDPCDAGAMCGRYNHTTICICDHNVIVASHTECAKMVECFSDDDCLFTEECRENKCHDPCAANSCGKNAFCAGVYYHLAVCVCNKGFTGDPRVGCEIKTPEN